MKFTDKEKKKFYKELRRYKLDLKCNWNEKQKKALAILLDPKGDYKDINEVGLWGWAWGSKTFTGVVWQWFMRVQYPYTESFWGRKKLKDVRGSVMSTYRKFCRIYNVPEALQGKFDWKDNILHFPNGSLIRFLELWYLPSDPNNDRFGSYEYTDGFIEESQQIDGETIGILKTRVGRQMNAEYNLPGRLLETFNPWKGHVYNRFWLPSEFKEGNMPSNRVFIRSLATDNKYNTEEYLQGLRTHPNPVVRERLYYWNFDYDDTPGKLFEYEDLMDLQNNPDNFWDLAIICDPARQGRDTAVITVWNGLTPIDYAVYDKSTNDVLENKIKEFAQKYKINARNIVVDEDWVWGWIVDHLKCVGFVNNSSPVDNRTKLEKDYSRVPKPNFWNLKDQVYKLLADNIRSINTKVFTPSIRDRIVEELDAVCQRDIDKDWPFRITKKEDIKKILGYSPDWADNFAMRMYLLLKPKRKKAVVLKI